MITFLLCEFHLNKGGREGRYGEGREKEGWKEEEKDIELEGGAVSIFSLPLSVLSKTPQTLAEICFGRRKGLPEPPGSPPGT